MKNSLFLGFFIVAGHIYCLININRIKLVMNDSVIGMYLHLNPALSISGGRWNVQHAAILKNQANSGTSYETAFYKIRYRISVAQA